MPARKDTAHRPSQSGQEFVRTKDGRRVRNTAFTGKASASKSAAGAGLKPASVSAGAGASAPHPDSVSGQFSRMKSYTEGGGVRVGKPLGPVHVEGLGSVEADSVIDLGDGAVDSVVQSSIGKHVFEPIGSDMPGEGTRTHSSVIEAPGGTFFVSASATGPQRVNGNLPTDEDGRLIPGTTHYTVSDSFGETRTGIFQGRNDGHSHEELGRKVYKAMSDLDAF